MQRSRIRNPQDKFNMNKSRIDESTKASIIARSHNGIFTLFLIILASTTEQKSKSTVVKGISRIAEIQSKINSGPGIRIANQKQISHCK
jgi:hypothetical protein